MTTSPSSTLPIAEIFTSIHGEGYWAGTPMTFIRLAGCTVGKSFVNNGPDPVNFPMFPDGKYMFQCTTFDGRTFPCDTDYRKVYSLSLGAILRTIPSHIKHVCITGGEPLMHGEKLTDLILYLNKFWVHIETSGSIEIQRPSGHLHITCSPKAGYVPSFVSEADEVRIPVGTGLTREAIDILMAYVKPQYQYVYFSPLCIGDTTVPEPESLKMCMDLVMQYPDTMVSIQMHKVLGVR